MTHQGLSRRDLRRLCYGLRSVMPLCTKPLLNVQDRCVDYINISDNIRDYIQKGYHYWDSDEVFLRADTYRDEKESLPVDPGPFVPPCCPDTLNLPLAFKMIYSDFSKWGYPDDEPKLLRLRMWSYASGGSTFSTTSLYQHIDSETETGTWPATASGASLYCATISSVKQWRCNIYARNTRIFGLESFITPGNCYRIWQKLCASGIEPIGSDYTTSPSFCSDTGVLCAGGNQCTSASTVVQIDNMDVSDYRKYISSPSWPCYDRYVISDDSNSRGSVLWHFPQRTNDGILGNSWTLFNTQDSSGNLIGPLGSVLFSDYNHDLFFTSNPIVVDPIVPVIIPANTWVLYHNYGGIYQYAYYVLVSNSILPSGSCSSPTPLPVNPLTHPPTGTYCLYYTPALGWATQLYVKDTIV